MMQLASAVPDRDGDAEDDWDRAWKLRAFECASRRVRANVREETWSAFWETAVRTRPAREVAEELSMSVGAIYVARSRVLARLRAYVDGLDGLELEAAAGGRES